MKKLISIVLILLFVLACNKPDKPVPSVDQVDPVGMEDDDAPDDHGQVDETSMLSINLETVSDLNLLDLSVLSAIGNTQITADSEMEDIVDKENSDLPIILTKDSNIVMGYFPETLTNGEVKIHDVVYFFFKAFPSLAVKRLNDTTLNNLLINSSNYEAMVDLVENALNQNVSVVDNPLFDDMVRDIIAAYDEATNKTSKIVVGEFKFDYSRDGNISIPKETSLFSTVGVQINKVGIDEPVYGPELLGINSLVLSPGSLFNYILDKYVLPIEPMSSNFQLPDDGTYEVIFSNGNSDYEMLDDKINSQNYSYFAVTALGYVVPFGIEKLYKSNSCSDEISGFLEVSRKYVKNLVESRSEPTVEDFIEYLAELSNQTISLSACYLGNSNYISDIIGFANKRLSIAEDIGEIVLFSQDFILSDISGKETRYFDNNISYGLLEYSNITDVEFSGKKGEFFRYEGIVEEKQIKYDVDREISSEFIKKEELVPAPDLPFQVALNSGDAILNGSNPIISDENGKVVLEGQFGEQDSEIEISSVISTADIEPFKITLDNNNIGSYTLQAVSSTNLLGVPNSTISEALEVRVVDSNNNPISNVPVIWEFLYGNRDNPEIISSITTNSNSEGIAETSWTLGSWSCGGDGSTYFNVDYAVASINGSNNQGTKVNFCSKKYSAILQVGANNSGGPNGIPVNGTVTMSFGEYSHTWTIQDNSIVGDDPSFGVTPADIVLPNQDTFDLSGSISVNLSRTANVTVTMCSSWEGCGGVSFNYGNGSTIIMSDSEGDFRDENGNLLPASKSVPIQVTR